MTDWDGGVYDYTFDDAHRLKQIVLPGGITTTYQYDEAGRLITLTHTTAADLLAEYVYSLDGVGDRVGTSETILTPVNPSDPPGSSSAFEVSFTYDGLGNRVAQTIDGEETQLVLDVVGLPEVIATSNGDMYLHLPGLIVQQQAGEGVQYLLADGLGSVRQVVNSTSQVVVVNEYDPYGVPSQGASSPYGYTSEWWQGEVSLLYLRARWYDAGTGRFLSRDPFPGFAQRPATLHLYTYAINNPTNATDPSGYQVAEGLVLTACAIEAPACLAGAVMVVAMVGGVALIYVTTDYLMQHPELWRPVYPPGQPGPEPAPEAQDYYQSPPGTQTETQTQPLDEWAEVANNAWNNWQPEPEHEPGRASQPVPLGPDIVVIPPTCTPEPKIKHISLGLNFVNGKPELMLFTYNLNLRLNPYGIYVYSYGDWFKEGLSDVPAGYKWPLAFDQASTRAQRIHFTLEGVDDPNDYAERFHRGGVSKGVFYFTADELYMIKTRPQLCSKTSFYRGGIESMSDWQEICGQ